MRIPNNFHRPFCCLLKFENCYVGPPFAYFVWSVILDDVYLLSKTLIPISIVFHLAQQPSRFANHFMSLTSSVHLHIKSATKNTATRILEYVSDCLGCITNKENKSISTYLPSVEAADSGAWELSSQPP